MAEVYIPLIFWFNNDDRLALPLVGIQRAYGQPYPPDYMISFTNTKLKLAFEDIDESTLD